jgi:hypothetical protein
VNDFTSGRLNNSAHDVNGSIVSVEKRRCGYNTDLVFRNIWYGFLHSSFIVSRIYELRSENFDFLSGYLELRNC